MSGRETWDCFLLWSARHGWKFSRRQKDMLAAERRRQAIARKLDSAVVREEMGDGSFPLNPTLGLSLAQAVRAAEQGDHQHAIWALRLLWLHEPARVQALLTHASPSVRLDARRAMAEAPRARTILAPCPVLGRAGDRLEPAQRRLIEGILGAHWQEWESNPVQPRRSGIFAATGDDPLARPPAPRIVVAFAKHIHGNPAFIESDFYTHLTSSAQAAGIEVYPFDAGEVQYEPARDPLKPRAQRPFEIAAAEFATFLGRVRPDFVVADGNYIPGDHSLDSAFWREQKARFGFKLVIILADCYDDLANFAAPWADCADLLIVFHGQSLSLVGLEQASALPTFPLSEGLFRRDLPKEFGVTCIGSDSRGRRDWMEALDAAGVPILLRLHDRSLKSAPGQRDYFELLGRSKLIFNNGFHTDLVNITTLRFFESVLSRALVLQENGAPVEDYFVPFVHYVPVANTDQAIAFARFLLEAEEWRARIADAALVFWDTNYASRLAWRFICRRMLG